MLIVLNYCLDLITINFNLSTRPYQFRSDFHAQKREQHGPDSDSGFTGTGRGLCVQSDRCLADIPVLGIQLRTETEKVGFPGYSALLKMLKSDGIKPKTVAKPNRMCIIVLY